MEDSIGVIDESLIHKVILPYNDSKSLNINSFILNLKCATLDDLIESLSDKKFIENFNEAKNIVLLSIEIENVNEHDNLGYVKEKYFTKLLEDDREIIVQVCDEIWIKSKGENMLSDLKEYPEFLDFVNEITDKQITGSKLKLSTAIKFMTCSHVLIIKLIKLFKFANQDEIDKKLFEEIATKSNFELFEVMMNFHSITNNRLKTHEIYAYLLSKDFNIFKEKLAENELEKITDEMTKYYNKGDPLIHDLLSISQIAMCSKNDEKKLWLRIQSYYEYLAKIPDLKFILQLADKKLKVIFDFKSDSIERSYPLGTKSDKGVFDIKRMQIMIGAKNEGNEDHKAFDERDYEIAGILIHELCHHALQKLFKNNCRPYSKDDEENERDFKRIINFYARKNENFHDEIVKRAFEYKEHLYPAELIVRAPQLIANYSHNENYLNNAKEKYEKLFAYFDEVIRTKAQNYLNPENQLKNKIKALSNFDNELLKFFPKTKHIPFDEEKSVHVITSSYPEMVAWQLQQQLGKSLPIITTFNHFVTNIDKVVSLMKQSEKVNLIIICKNGKSFDAEHLSNIKNIFIIVSDCSFVLKTLKENNIDHDQIAVNYKFSDLSVASKNKALKILVKFQGRQVELENLLNSSSEFLQDVNLEKFNSEKIVIGRKIEKNDGYDEGYFIERTLTYEIKKDEGNFDFKTDSEQVITINQNSAASEKTEFTTKIVLTENINEIHDLMTKYKLLLFKNSAGEGKSTILTHLALQLQNATNSNDPFDLDDDIPNVIWIIKLNLHLYTEIFSKINYDLSNYEFIEFIYTQFAAKSKDNIEREIFKEFLTQQRIIFILDGFDEIMPFCGNNVKKFIKKCFELGVANIFVSTRPYFENDFAEFDEEMLSLKLNPFTLQNQLDFTTKFLHSKSQVNERISLKKIEELTERTLANFFFALNDINPNMTVLSTPLHSYMMAYVLFEKIIENNFDLNSVDKDREHLNFYTLYKKFILINKLIATREKGSKITRELICDGDNLNCIVLNKAYKKLAFCVVFAPEINPDITSKEKDLMLRYGLVTKNHKKLHFIHRSFAEFFVAEEILDTLIKGNIKETVFANHNLLIKIFSLMPYESIRMFVDSALSIEKIYEKLSEKSLKALGCFLIDEFNFMDENFNSMEIQWKNFIHLIIENEKGIVRRAYPRFFVFLSHLCLTSIFTICDYEKETIKKILESTWYDVQEARSYGFKIDNLGPSGVHVRQTNKFNPETGKITESVHIFNDTIRMTQFDHENLIDGKLYGDMHGENLLILVCRINIKCLINIVLDIAKKVFDKDGLKKYFLSKNPFRTSHLMIFNYNLESIFERIIDGVYFKKSIYYAIFYKSIQELRSSEKNETINLNDDENFHHSSIYDLIEYAMTLDLSEEEKLEWTKSFYNFETQFELYENCIFFFLNVFIKVQKDLFANEHHEKSNKNYYYRATFYYFVMTGITQYPENSEIIYKILDFIKEKLEKADYLQNLSNFFVCSMETIINIKNQSLIPEKSAKIMYEIMQSTFNEAELNWIFLNNNIFIHKYSCGQYNIIRLKHGITLYCKLLIERHLNLLMLNKSVDNTTVFCRLIHISPDIAEHTLNCLKERISDEENLFKLFNQTEIFSNYSGFIDLINTLVCSCEENFNLLLSFLKENFDNTNWRKLFNEIDDYGQTILHKVVLQNTNKYEKLNKIAIEQLKKDYMKVFLIKDIDHKSVNDLRKIRR